MTDEMVQVPKAALEGLMATLAAAADGHYDGRAPQDGESAEWRALAGACNAALASFGAHSDEYHERSMELAMGMSECFEVLTNVRSGNLDVAVGDATTGSPEPIVAKLGELLNETVDQLRDHAVRQQYTIRELSTPILHLWSDVLAMPIIGVVDTRRSADIMERMLGEIVRRQSRFVILDITGVDVVDTRTADYFIKMVKAAQLLGSHCLLTGIQPAVAQTLVEIGVDLSSITTLRDLQAGLRECLRQMGDRLGGDAAAPTHAGGGAPGRAVA